nr:AAA domain-containing protein [Sphingopyxis fribergensis]
MADLLGFRALLEDGDVPLEIPGAIAALFTEPSSAVADEDFPTFRGINSIPGVTSSDGAGADLFFPKPFNGEQVQIAQRLAVGDGVVVQGPPGTGKTHTIANIISHYLATGRRVLVTSQKTPALQVLQEQLPAPIRPLAVSLLDSDREGLRQFRASVDLIAERLQGLRRSEIDSEIDTLDSRIDGLHRTLANLDRQIEELGRNALQSVMLNDQAIPPLDAAKEVWEAGDDAWWIEDAITPDPRHTPSFGSDDLAACRLARSELGELLGYLGKPLPPADLFADIEAIVSTHTDLAQAAAIRREINSGALWPLVDETPETLDAAAVLHERLSAWTLKRDALGKNAPPWDNALEALLAAPSDPLLLAIRGLKNDASELADDHAWFMTRPVELPAEALDDPRFVAAVEGLQSGGQGLGGLAGLFARRTKQSLSGVRLRGKPPRGAEEWQAVARHIRSQERATMFTASWNHACTTSDVPRLASTGPAAGREAMRVVDRLESLFALHSEAVVLTKEVSILLPQWRGAVERHQDMGSTLYCLKLHLDRARLAKAEGVRRHLLVEIGAHETELHADARALVSSLGMDAMSVTECREQAIALSGRIEHLHRLRPHFDTVNDVAEKVTSSGAPRWASRLCSAPAIGEDVWCPSDWRRRWRLRQLASWLDASQKLGAFRTLHAERQRAEGDLSRAYTRLIEQRTWRELKKQASPAVMTALSAYAVAVGRIGKGTGKSANRHRKTARHAANAVKGALPCWIMPHHRVSESLPAELGIFDLVIVDEASQSTLAALPALFRARQILVVGDDKQVSPDHVGLAMDQANARAARYLTSQVALFQAPMREEASLYDLASVIFGGDNLMLREHFRCAAPIIEFSKRQFYRNELRPLRLSKSSERLDPVLIDVRVTDGYRKGKTNPPEADYIVSELRRMGDDPSFDDRTFGVTTLLGTEQAALIYKRIEGELGIPFIEKYHLRVGDPSAFQGDERDVMFLSMVVTAGNATALSGLGYEQRFNVAASRARERMILVRSIELDQLSPRDALRRAILEHFRSPFPADAADMQDARDRCESDFEREMFDLLAERGYSVDTQVKVGAHRIDMVVDGDEDRRLAIECDGDRYHGPEQWPSDMARQRTLERAGWRVWRCFASRFVRERTAVVEELAELLSTMDIQPRSASGRSRTYTELREWNSLSGTNEIDEADTDEDDASLGDDLLSGETTNTDPLQPVATRWNGHDTTETISIAPIGISEPSSPPSANTAQRVTETDVQAAILELLGNGEVWTNAELKQALSHVLPLHAGDRQQSSSRPNEEKWEELVNNALASSGRSNSLYARGLVSKAGFGMHRLAERDDR